jgi:exopolysaccharide biosynthesis polyprenyl glycosylphosphotransferase
MNQPRIHINGYIIGDILISLITWLLFYYLRTLIYDYAFSMPPGFYLGMTLYVSGWIFLHFLSGAYKSVYLKSRLGDAGKTMFISLLGCLFLLFFFILKNPQSQNRNYYMEFFALLIPHLLLTVSYRQFILSIAKKQLRSKKVFFPALLTGDPEKAAACYRNFEQTRETGGFQLTGYYPMESGNSVSGLPTFQAHTPLATIIRENQIEEVIVAVRPDQREYIKLVLQQLSDQEVNIKIIPDTVDIISGSLQTNNVLGVPLIDIHAGILPDWQQNVKRLLDVTIATLGLIVLSPLMLYTWIRVRFSSPGPVLFIQERIGYKGRPFQMIKFRSMYTDAEKDGPRLSHDHDERITNWGKTMRKWRLDELPQLWNILKGEMSLVGPRPERKHYINQIILQHPEYNYLFKVKPGLTSWGMVNFGYASSVDDMIQRMPFDLLYVENASLALDLKILFYTMQIILSGQGK